MSLSYSVIELTDIKEILEGKVLAMENQIITIAKTGATRRTRLLSLSQLKIQSLVDKTNLMLENREHLAESALINN